MNNKAVVCPVNYIAPARQSLVPIYAQTPATRPAVSVSHATNRFRDASRQQPSTYVYRGEIIEAVRIDRLYRPQFNLQINPLNLRAIDIYHKVALDQASPGRILDRFI